MKSIALAMIAAGILNTAVRAEPPCTSVRVTNGHAREVKFANGPVTLFAEVRILPDARHRYLHVTWEFAEPDTHVRAFDDVDDPFREIEEQNGPIGSWQSDVNGDKGHVRTDVKMTHLFGGTYVVTATVFTDEARKHVCGRATTRVVIR